MTLEATSAIDNPWVKQAFESLPETRNGDWYAFRLNTIDKSIKGVQKPNEETFKALYAWMYTVNKGPDLSTISET
tara:strand:+ start:36 stop:260 length:225 start_codon:yes stop_codon:yes gene_type:complete